MNVRHVLLLIAFLPAIAAAQPYTSIKGWFEVDQQKGCAPFTITITDTELVESCNGNCSVDWGEGAPPSGGVFTHQYVNPGTYMLFVNYDAGRGPDSIPITVFPNIQPTFEVYSCSGNQVQVKVTDTNYDSYIIEYSDDATATVEIPRGSSPVNHTFTSSGTVSVHGKNAASDDNCLPPANRNISFPFPPFNHLINQLIITNNSTIDLQLNTQQNVLYRLEIAVNGGTFQNLGNLYGVSTATIPGLNTDDNFYCFRLGKVNPCAGGVLYSPTICSADLAVSAQNNANNLTWTTSLTGVSNFTIVKDEVTLIPSTLATTFVDNAVTCGTENCYQIITNYADGTSFSTIRCVTAISTNVPTAIDEVTSVVNGGSVDLIWQPDAVFTAETYSVLRQSNGGSFSSIESEVSVTQYTDTDYKIDNHYCYRIDYIDECGNTSNPGIVTCPIILGYSTNSNDDIILTWSAYTGWASGVMRYELDKYDLQHNGPETFNLGSALTYTDNDLTDQGYYFVVRAVPNDDVGNEQSVSNEVMAVRGLRFAYPKAFTPDNQGPVENEMFKVFVTEEFIAHFEMKIFNRWGEMIYSTTDLLKGWDGKFNGQPQPEGTYTFTATLKDKTGRSFKRDGSVMLLRKK